MSASGDKTAEQIRTKAFQILERAKSEPAYLQSLQEDPETALHAAGFTNPETGQLIDELGLADVKGYLAEVEPPDCQFTCNTGTCWITRCAFIPVTNA